ncbi:hypothetical protein WA158_006426 [Blastocystis sp. Blastoise]
MKSIVVLFFCVLALSAQVNLDVDWKEFMSRNDPVWKFDAAHPSSFPYEWFDSPFSGNGILGMFVDIVTNSDHDAIQFSLGRTDAWDHREPGSKYYIGYNEYDECRIKLGYFNVEAVGKIINGTMRMDLYNARIIGSVETTEGKIDFVHRVDSNNHIISVEVETEGNEKSLKIAFTAQETKEARGHRDDYVKNPLPYCNETTYKNKDYTVCSYDLLAGGDIAVGYHVEDEGSKKTLFTTVDNSVIRGKQRDILAKDNVIPMLDSLMNIYDNKMLEAHEQWWHNYYSKSFLSIPDTKMESFYWIQLYKTASASRCTGPDNCWPYDLMGPWYVDTTWSDYHHDLNIQMAAWSLWFSNHQELFDNMVLFHKLNMDNFKYNVPEEMREDAGAVGTETGWDFMMGKYSWGTKDGLIAPGGNVVAGNLIWNAQVLYTQYRYSLNETNLREVVYPILRQATNYYIHVMTRDSNNTIHLPYSMSPEYANDEDTNWDISLFKWGCKTIIHICKDILHIDDPYLSTYQDVLDHIVDYPHDNDGLKIGKNVKLTSMHRHWSHMFMIYPLHLMDTYNTPERTDLINKSIQRFIDFKPYENGFGIVSSAIISSLLPNKDDFAYDFIDIFWKMGNLGHSTMYWESGHFPCNESPYGLAAALQYFIIRSDITEYIHIFPIHPKKMDTVYMYNSKAEGGFAISGVMKNSTTQWLSIRSEFGSPLVIRVDDLLDMEYTPSSIPVTKNGDGIYSIDLKKDEEVFLYPRGTTPDFTVSVYPAKEEDCHAWGKH